MNQSSNPNASHSSGGTTSTGNTGSSNAPIKTTAQQQSTTATTVGTGNRFSAADIEKILKDNKSLREALEQNEVKLKIAQKANEEYKQTNEELSNRVAAIEQERRTDKIASILSGAYKQEDLQANVDRFVKSGLAFEDIENIVAPLKAAKVDVTTTNTTEHQTEQSTTGKKSAAGCGCQGNHTNNDNNNNNNNNNNKTKSASQHYDSKASIRNARLEDVSNNNSSTSNNETPIEPSFITTRNYLFNGGVD